MQGTTPIDSTMLMEMFLPLVCCWLSWRTRSSLRCGILLWMALYTIMLDTCWRSSAKVIWLIFHVYVMNITSFILTRIHMNILLLYFTYFLNFLSWCPGYLTECVLFSDLKNLNFYKIDIFKKLINSYF